MSPEEALTAALRDVEVTREPGGYPHLGQDNDIRRLAKDLCDLLEVDGYTIVRSDDLARLRGALEAACDAWVAEFGPPDYPSPAPTWYRDARAALEDRP